MAERVTGTVVDWNTFLGVGFIKRDFCRVNEGHVYVEMDSVRKGGTFKLELGLRVEFVMTPGKRGPQAEDVTLVE